MIVYIILSGLHLEPNERDVVVMVQHGQRSRQEANERETGDVKNLRARHAGLHRDGIASQEPGPSKGMCGYLATCTLRF